MRRAKIISGFPGVGKTYAFIQFKKLVVLDSDSSQFSWEPGPNRVRHHEWPDNYLRHIESHLDDSDIICVSSHEIVRQKLVEHNLYFNLVYPSLEIKEEYIDRYRKRGNNQAFVDLLVANYDTWVKDLQQQSGCNRIELASGQYLIDVLDKVV